MNYKPGSAIICSDGIWDISSNWFCVKTPISWSVSMFTNIWQKLPSKTSEKRGVRKRYGLKVIHDIGNE